MNRLSVRLRLTLLVTFLAAGLGVISATLGVSRVESGLIAEALDDAGDDQIAFADDVFSIVGEFGDGIEVDEFGEGIGSDLFLADDLFLFEEVDIVRAMLAEIDQAGGLEGLLGAAEVGEGEGLVVLTSFARIAVVGLDDEVTLLPDGVLEVGGARIVSQLTIEEIYFRIVEPDFEGVFLEELLDLTPTAVELPDFRYGTRVSNGVDFVVVADVSDVVRSVDRIRSLAWIVTPILVLLGAGATWLLTGRALRPVHEITDRVGVISGGSLHERVPQPAADDEIAELARTMNQMLDRLESDDKRLRRFVSDASHELRSPIAVLLSEAEIAQREPSATTVGELADGVFAESTRLQRVVEDLLVLARGEEYRAAGGFGPVDLDDIVLGEAQRRRRLPVDVQLVSAGRVWGTTEGCARIITHLLDNAARHGARLVSVGLRTEGHTVTLWVDDDGPGIAELDRGRVFERFTRLDEARTRDGGGAGLGLAVVAETVAAMGGTVELLTAPGGGARFALHWPAVIG